MSVKKLARRLARLYYASIFAQGATRGYTRHKRHQIELSDLTKLDRKAFLRTAKTVEQLDADPREYIMAQFHAFAEYTRFTSRYMLPRPNQLWSLQAIIRYQTYKGQQELRNDRLAPKITTLHTYEREERKLAGLVRMTRQLSEEVLITYPGEFSKEFLKHKGVWSLVSDSWRQDRGIN